MLYKNYFGLSSNLRCAALFRVFFVVVILFQPHKAHTHEITFCGEVIPLSEDFVVNKLMNVIRKQMPGANLPALKYKASRWFPTIEKYLTKHGLPLDFKYLPIVESGFANVESKAGAYGFWQLMPETAKEYNLIVNDFLDERDDPVKSTHVACLLIKNYYNYIKRNSNTSSWVLTAAAYNTGIGNIMKAVRKQGSNYFRMDLNPETAEYVYKLIAIKELFENPELYMNGFGRNVFTESAATLKKEKANASAANKVDEEFSAISFSVKDEKKPQPKQKEIYYIPAEIFSPGKKFKDGQLVSILLGEDLKLPGKFNKKGNVIKGIGWKVENRVYINLGYGHAVQVMDIKMTKGIPEAEISKKGQTLFLKVEV